MKTLKRYFAENGIRYSSWAKDHHIPPPVICRYLKQQHNLSPANARRISEATGGQVTVMELLFPDQCAEPATEDQAA